ncbi:hypothetical protein V6N11_037557 [Hibiscus sabdariffa]|uniref:Uncharacterized protein n=2 Tax=Hibiscus sabdariffa TaxID=183260 RepID=A0ABR2P1T5_9ROSI
MPEDEDEGDDFWSREMRLLEQRNENFGAVRVRGSMRMSSVSGKQRMRMSGVSASEHRGIGDDRRSFNILSLPFNPCDHVSNSGTEGEIGPKYTNMPEDEDEGDDFWSREMRLLEQRNENFGAVRVRGSMRMSSVSGKQRMRMSGVSASEHRGIGDDRRSFNILSLPFNPRDHVSNSG